MSALLKKLIFPSIFYMRYTNDWIHWFQYMVAFGIYWADLSFKQESSAVKLKACSDFCIMRYYSRHKGNCSPTQTCLGQLTLDGTRQNQVSGASGHSKKQRTCIPVMHCTAANDLQVSKFASFRLTWVPFCDTEVICAGAVNVTYLPLICVSSLPVFK